MSERQVGEVESKERRFVFLELLNVTLTRLCLDERALNRVQCSVNEFWETMINFLVHDKYINTLVVTVELSREQQVSLMEMLRVNRSIVKVTLDGSFSEYAELARTLRSNETLKVLWFYNCPLSIVGSGNGNGVVNRSKRVPLNAPLLVERYKKKMRGEAKREEEEEDKSEEEEKEKEEERKRTPEKQIKMIFDVLREENHSLRELLVSGDLITNENVKEFSRVLDRNLTLTHNPFLLFGHHKTIDPKLVSAIESKLERNRELHKRYTLIKRTILLIRAIKPSERETQLSRVPKKLLLYLLEFIERNW